MGWAVKSAELRLLEPEEKLLASYNDTPQSLHTYSNATPQEGVTAELVDVGAGIKPADYEGKDVKDKFVLATGRAKSVHEQAVYKFGAAGVFTDSITFEIPNVRESLDIPDAHAYQSIWPTAEVLDKVRFGFSLSKRQGNQLRILLKRGKPVKLKAKVDARLFPGNLDVVTATVQGGLKSEEEVFLVAHLCHPKPSANDNASGSGLLLEIARTINGLIESGKIERPARTIRFLWVPETFGSVCYLYGHEDLPTRLVAGINLDMVGQNQELCKSTLNLDRTPDSLPSYLNDLVFRFMQESVKEFDVPSSFGSSSVFRYATGAFSGGSDHAEFTDSTIGVPCVMLLQWPDLFYHTSMDTLDKVSEDSLKRVGWIATNVMLTLANATFETAFQLAHETASRGIVRIEEANQEAVEELFKKRQNPRLRDKPEELARELKRTASFHKNRIEHFAWREQEAVKSVRRLGESAELNASLSVLCRNIADIATQELARLQEALSFVAKTSALTLSNQNGQAESNKELSVVPKRLFKGPLDSNVLRKTLSEKELEMYEEVRKIDEDFDKKTAEVLNFMNGKRSIYEIVLAVSAEYSETNPEHVLKFLRDLEKSKLVELC
jgi:aminopeptidase YwaD